MNNTKKPDASERKIPSAAAGLDNSNDSVSDKVVIPDECGDSMWDEVLAQQSALSKIINKPEGTGTNGDAANIQSSK